MSLSGMAAAWIWRQQTVGNEQHRAQFLALEECVHPSQPSMIAAQCPCWHRCSISAPVVTA